MGLGPKTSTQQVRSQATPFAEDFLAYLTKEIGSGDPFGLRSSVRDVASPDKLITDMEKVMQRNLARSSADLTEAYGSEGARFGSAIAGGQADLRGQTLDNLAQALSALELNLNELGIQRDLGIGEQMLQGLNLAGNVAATGIHPDQTIVRDSGMMSALKLFTPIVASVLGGPAGGAIASGISGLFGGGGTRPAPQPAQRGNQFAPVTRPLGG